MSVENIFPELLVVPTHLWGGGGGGELYTQMFFFQTILADRYIHPSELSLVSLEARPAYNMELNRFFFVFYRELSRFKVLKLYMKK